MTASDMWAQYTALHPEFRQDSFEAWAYGDAPDELAALTLQGAKTATASLHTLYAIDGEALPQAGDFSVVLDFRDEAVCIIRTTAVRILPFREVDERQACLEGEGDRSLAWWRRVHEAFFRRELASCKLVFTEDVAVVCEEFEVVYP